MLHSQVSDHNFYSLLLNLFTWLCCIDLEISSMILIWLAITECFYLYQLHLLRILLLVVASRVYNLCHQHSSHNLK